MISEMLSRAVSLALLTATSIAVCADGLQAQRGSGGGFYAFDERKPKSKLEQTVAALLPSIVKVHGASGLSTIQAYATGIIVSKTGYIVTLDQVLIQKGQTKVVLHDGSVLDVVVLPAELKYGVRMLKISDADLKKLKKPLVPVAIPKKQDHRNGTFVVSLGNCLPAHAA